MEWEFLGIFFSLEVCDFLIGKVAAEKGWRMECRLVDDNSFAGCHNLSILVLAAGFFGDHGRLIFLRWKAQHLLL